MEGVPYDLAPDIDAAFELQRLLDSQLQPGVPQIDGGLHPAEREEEDDA